MQAGTQAEKICRTDSANSLADIAAEVAAELQRNPPDTSRHSRDDAQSINSSSDRGYPSSRSGASGASLTRSSMRADSESDKISNYRGRLSYGSLERETFRGTLDFPSFDRESFRGCESSQAVEDRNTEGDRNPSEQRERITWERNTWERGTGTWGEASSPAWVSEAILEEARLSVERKDSESGEVAFVDELLSCDLFGENINFGNPRRLAAEAFQRRTGANEILSERQLGSGACRPSGSAHSEVPPRLNRIRRRSVKQNCNKMEQLPAQPQCGVKEVRSFHISSSQLTPEEADQAYLHLIAEAKEAQTSGQLRLQRLCLAKTQSESQIEDGSSARGASRGKP